MNKISIRLRAPPQKVDIERISHGRTRALAAQFYVHSTAQVVVYDKLCCEFSRACAVTWRSLGLGKACVEHLTAGVDWSGA